MAARSTTGTDTTKRSQDAAAPVGRRRLWRLAALAAALLLLVVLGWSPWCRQQATIAMAARDYEAAERWINRAVWMGESAESRFLRARLARKFLEVNRAIDELDAAAKAGLAESQMARERLLIQAQSGRLTGVEHELKRWFLNPDADFVDVSEAYANGLLMNGRATDAALVIASWKMSEPRDPQPFVNWGRWLESQLQIAPAEQEYAAALERNPRFAPAHYSLGRLKLNRNEANAALVHFESTAQVLQANAAPRIGMARCLQELGQLDQAIALLEDVVRQPAYQIARSFALVQDPDPTRPAERVMGELLARTGASERALPYLDRALSVEPRDPTLRYLKAQCLQSSGRTEEARPLFEQVAADRAAMAEADRLVDEIDQQPGEPQIERRLRVGELFWKHDSARKAEFWLKSVLRYEPRNSAAHRLLAEYYELRSHEDTAFVGAANFHRRAGAANSSSTGTTER